MSTKVWDSAEPSLCLIAPWCLRDFSYETNLGTEFGRSGYQKVNLWNIKHFQVLIPKWGYETWRERGWREDMMPWIIPQWEALWTTSHTHTHTHKHKHVHTHSLTHSHRLKSHTFNLCGWIMNCLHPKTKRSRNCFLKVETIWNSEDLSFAARLPS